MTQKRNKDRKHKNRPQDKGFLQSLEFRQVLLYAVVPCLFAIVAVYGYLLYLSMVDNPPDISHITNEAKFPSKKPIPLSNEFQIRKHPIEEIDWSDTDYFMDNIIQKAKPVLIKNSPVANWAASSWDLGDVASSGLILNGSRLQTLSPVFVLGYERDKGGMLGKESDLPVSYVDVYLKDFLQSVFEKDTFMYWTGPASTVKSHMDTVRSGDSRYNIGPWEVLKVVEDGLNISFADDNLWVPMLWLSHPGVIAQTHFDTQHNFFAQVLGKKKILIFEQYSELYPYPSIHISGRQSQVRLENSAPVNTSSQDSKTVVERFPLSKRLDATEVAVIPGDLLYIPPYWSHRVESETLAMSISVLSPSATEVRALQRSQVM